MNSARELVGGVAAALLFVLYHLLLRETVHGEDEAPHVVRKRQQAWAARERRQVQLLAVNKSVVRLPVAAG